MWGLKKTARKLDDADDAMLQRVRGANADLPESWRITATIDWVKGMLLSDDAVTRELGRGALVRIAEAML